jgi:hypothetical protein
MCELQVIQPAIHRGSFTKLASAVRACLSITEVGIAPQCTRLELESDIELGDFPGKRGTKL